MSKPNWSHWANLAEVELDAAIDLSCNVSPGFVIGSAARLLMSGKLDPGIDFDLVAGAISARRQIAMSHVQAGSLRVRTVMPEINFGSGKEGQTQHFVTLTAFRAWGESLPHPFTFPDEFPRSETIETISADRPQSGRWPWGDHETKLLQKLAEAAEKFWKLYDPSDATTAPTNEKVSEWLRANGVADRNAEVMARILRADGLPTGPRT